MSLLERMQYVLEMHPGWSARDWARASGLKEESHVTTTMRRLREKPDATVSTKTLAALARGGGVSAEWLSTGRGTPTGAYVMVNEPDRRYPTRGQAVAGARLFGWDLRAIAKVQAIDDFPDDPGLKYWLARLEAEHEAAIRDLPSSAPPGPPRLPAGRPAGRKRR